MTSIDDFVADFVEEPGYLDFAQFGPMSGRVASEFALHSEVLSKARFGALEHLVSHELRVNQAVAALTGFRSEQVVFQQNSSVALMAIMFGLSGGVLLWPHEFPSGPSAVRRAAEATGRVFPVWLDSTVPAVTPEHVAAALTPEVTAVQLSLVDYRTGFRVDLAGIRRVIGDRLLIVNASQGFGVVDEEFTAADVLVTNGFKWLRAGFDTGFMVLSDRALERITPAFGIFSGYDAAAPISTEPGALERTGTAADFRSGPQNPAAQSRLAIALEELAAVGISAVASRVEGRVAEVIALAEQYGVPVASPREPERRAGIVILTPSAGHLGVLYAALHNHGITVTQFPGSVRLSVHASTGRDTLALLALAFTSYASARAVR